MHQACSEGHVQCLKALLEAGATIDGCDCRGHKPVDLAKLWGQRTCARYHCDNYLLFLRFQLLRHDALSHLIARSHSSTFNLSLARVFSTSFYPVYQSPTLSSVCVLHLSSSHARTSSVVSVCSFFGILRHSCCPLYVFFPVLVCACHSANPSSHPHLVLPYVK